MPEDIINRTTGKKVGTLTDEIYVSGIPTKSETTALYALSDMLAAINLGIQGIEDSIQLRAEVEHWRNKYSDLLTDSVRAAEQSANNLLVMALHSAIGDYK